MKDRYNTVIYARLSSDDGHDSVSQSIVTQIDICKDFIRKNNFKLLNIYIDDGYSGTNFNRPQFKKMIEDVKCNNIDIIIFKDLSRFGRNFVQGSYYLEEFFPSYDVRVISINDNYDSLKSEDDISLPIKNYLNERYAKETSKKIRQYFECNVDKIPFVHTEKYGYLIKDNKFTIDPNTKDIIKKIFDMSLNGFGAAKIAKYLSDSKIERPRYYYKVKIKKAIPTEKEEIKKHQWYDTTVLRILRDKTYIGTISNRKCCKNKSIVILENNHDAIIDIDTFNKVQSKLNQHKRKYVILNDDIRLKKFFYTENGSSMFYREVRNQKGTPRAKKYISLDNKLSIKADIAHKVAYMYAYKAYNQIITNKQDFINQYKKKYQIINNQKSYDNLLNQKDKIDSKIQILIESLYLNKITIDSYNKKLNELKTQLIDVEQKLYDENINNSINDMKIKKIKQFINQLPDEIIDNKMEFIKSMIYKIIISKDGSSMKFKVIYNFDK